MHHLALEPSSWWLWLLIPHLSPSWAEKWIARPAMDALGATLYWRHSPRTSATPTWRLEG